MLQHSTCTRLLNRRLGFFLQASVYLARSGKGNSRRVKARSVHAPARRLARTTITLGPDEGIAFGLRAVRYSPCYFCCCWHHMSENHQDLQRAFRVNAVKCHSWCSAFLALVCVVGIVFGLRAVIYHPSCSALPALRCLDLLQQTIWKTCSMN